MASYATFPFCLSLQVFWVNGRTIGTIKTQVAKILDAYSFPRLRVLPMVLPQFQIHSFDKHHFSPIEIIGRQVRLDKRLYNLILLKADILYYYKSLIKLLTSHSKLVSKAYYCKLSSNKDQMSHDLQPGDYMYKKKKTSFK